MLGNTNTSKKTLENQKSNFSRSVLFHMRAGVSLRYFVNNCSCIILAAEETTSRRNHQQGQQRRKEQYSIESERGREANWMRINQKKESRLKKKAKRKQTAEAALKEQKPEKQKVGVPGIAQKAKEREGGNYQQTRGQKKKGL